MSTILTAREFPDPELAVTQAILCGMELEAYYVEGLATGRKHVRYKFKFASGTFDGYYSHYWAAVDYMRLVEARDAKARQGA